MYNFNGTIFFASPQNRFLLLFSWAFVCRKKNWKYLKSFRERKEEEKGKNVYSLIKAKSFACFVVGRNFLKLFKNRVREWGNKRLIFIRNLTWDLKVYNDTTFSLKKFKCHARFSICKSLLRVNTTGWRILHKMLLHCLITLEHLSVRDFDLINLWKIEKTSRNWKTT